MGVALLVTWGLVYTAPHRTIHNDHSIGSEHGIKAETFLTHDQGGLMGCNESKSRHCFTSCNKTLIHGATSCYLCLADACLSYIATVATICSIFRTVPPLLHLFIPFWQPRSQAQRCRCTSAGLSECTHIYLLPILLHCLPVGSCSEQPLP